MRIEKYFNKKNFSTKLFFLHFITDVKVCQRLKLFQPSACRLQSDLGLLNGCIKWDKLHWKCQSFYDQTLKFYFFLRPTKWHFLCVLMIRNYKETHSYCRMWVWRRLAIKKVLWPVICMIFTNAQITHGKLPSSHYRWCFFFFF